jgi:uncharacterized flavoprotein (TIGR03862 family)
MQTAPIVIIGAGPAGLMAAQRLAEAGKKVHIYEQNKASARKFLVAGHGGFNLTHSEAISDLIVKYDKIQIQHIVQSFDNEKTVSWLKSIGVETYVGSSGKIFPIKSIKPIQVLQAWLERLRELGVEIHYEHKFLEFENTKVILENNGIVVEKEFSKLILALGGGSWKKTGSDAKWIPILAEKEITIRPLASANSGYNTSADYAEIEGQVLKNIEVRFGETKKKGEIVFTNYGIEGSPIYYLNRFTRTYSFPLTIHIDLKPNQSEEAILALLITVNKISDILKNTIKLNKTALALLKKLDKETYIHPVLLAKAIKGYPIQVENFRPIDEVISTAGGVRFDEVNQALALKKYPNVYCIGEMLDWEAPTGGYLLQACFSMGHYCAEQILKLKI